MQFRGFQMAHIFKWKYYTRGIYFTRQIWSNFRLSVSAFPLKHVFQVKFHDENLEKWYLLNLFHVGMYLLQKLNILLPFLACLHVAVWHLVAIQSAAQHSLISLVSLVSCLMTCIFATSALLRWLQNYTSWPLSPLVTPGYKTSCIYRYLTISLVRLCSWI